MWRKPQKKGGLPSGGMRKSRMVLAAFVPESPAHRHKLQGLCDYAAKAGWTVETVVNIGALGQSITSPDELDIYDGFVIDFWPLYHIINPLRLQRPVVSVDRSFDDACGIDTVRCDSRAVGVTAAQELLGRDTASISFVAPALDWEFFKERKESFISTVEAAGRKVQVWSIGDKDDRIAERRRLAEWLRSPMSHMRCFSRAVPPNTHLPLRAAPSTPPSWTPVLTASANYCSKRPGRSKPSPLHAASPPQNTPTRSSRRASGPQWALSATRHGKGGSNDGQRGVAPLRIPPDAIFARLRGFTPLHSMLELYLLILRGHAAPDDAPADA